MIQNVLVGVNTYPGHSYCRGKFIERVQALGCDVYMVWNGEGKPNKLFPKTWKIDIYKERASERGLDILRNKQNMIRDYFLKNKKYTHLFMAESDNFFPANIVRKFLGYKRDMVTGLYFIDSNSGYKIPLTSHSRVKYAEQFEEYNGEPVVAFTFKHIPCVWDLDDEGNSAMWQFNDWIYNRGFRRIFASGLGAVLIKRKVLDKVKFRLKHEDDPHQQFTDFMFYWDAYKLGYELWLDGDTIVGHEHHEEDTFAQKKWFDAKDLSVKTKRAAF